jgi:hypothetical protein
MPRPSRNLVLVAMLMALGLSATAVGHPHPIHEPVTSQEVQQQLAEYPVGLYRYYEEALAAQAQTATLLRCVDPGNAEGQPLPDQIAKTSSSNAIATRRLVGSSTASS